MDKREVLKGVFGYDSFREGQEEIIDALLSGRDALAVMPTGAGKSICYQVPALLMPGITVVVSPLISLMQDQVKALGAAGVRAAYINSSLTEGQIRKALDLAAQGTYKIIYVAPERLLTSGFLSFADRADISMVTVDEAHCISQWGQDFRPSYQRIVDFVGYLPRRPVIGAFTATATQEVKVDIENVLGLVDPLVLVTGYDRPNLYFEVDLQKDKDAFVLSYVKEHRGESGIIYCATRKNVDKVFELLFRAGESVGRYHAGMESEQRSETQRRFLEDELLVIVCTNAFGMGIDKSNVRYVLHYNMPSCLEDYYQEAGRAGRDGLESNCILLYSEQDVMIDRLLLQSKDFSQMEEEESQAIMERDARRLSMMRSYCLSTSCLRAQILSYFGQEHQASCGHCSGCLRDFEEVDMTAQAKWVANCCYETKGRFGASLIRQILLGSHSARIREISGTSFRCFGQLSGCEEEQIRQLIAHMVEEEYLLQTNERYSVLKLGPRAGELSRPETRVMMRIIRQEAPRVKRRSSSLAGLTSTGFALFEKLKALRGELAKRDHVPPYIVFSDKTLISMCEILPGSLEAFHRVSGVGKVKAEKYGEDFLSLIREFLSENEGKVLYEAPEEASQVPEGAGQKAAGSPSRPKGRGRKGEFILPPERIGDVELSERCYLSELRDRINAAAGDDPERKPLYSVRIQEYLTTCHLLEEVGEGKEKTYQVSPEGREAGLGEEEKVSARGTRYTVQTLPRKVQEMVIAHYSSPREE